MKLHSKSIDSTGAGKVRLTAEDSEDMWHLYNLIQVGDTIKASTFRKVAKDTSAGTTNATASNVTQQKLHITLTIQIEAIEFDSLQGELRLKGKNVEENEYVKLGQYHTIEVEVHRSITLTKQHWDSMHLERIEEACNQGSKAEIAAIIMQTGLAHLCLIMKHMTLVKQRIELSIPRKRGGGSVIGHEQGVEKFFGTIYQAMRRNINLESVKAVIIASPGFLKDDYYSYMLREAQRLDDKPVLQAKSKFLLSHSSSGYKHSLKEVLGDPLIQSQLQNTKAYDEVKALDAFFEMMHTDPDRAYYGYAHCNYADEQKAVDTLLVTDDLFRSNDANTRHQYIQLVENVRENGGTVVIFSAQHVSGEQLSQLTGVAAILRFPLAEEDVMELERLQMNKLEIESAGGSSVDGHSSQHLNGHRTNGT